MSSHLVESSINIVALFIIFTNLSKLSDKKSSAHTPFELLNSVD